MEIVTVKLQSSLTIQSKSVGLRVDFTFATNNKSKNPHLITCCKQTIQHQNPVQSDNTVQVQGTTAMDGWPPSLGSKIFLKDVYYIRGIWHLDLTKEMA